MTFATNLKRHRLRLKMSMQDLTDASGVAKSAISRIEAGTQSPTLGTAERLACAMKLTLRGML